MVDLYFIIIIEKSVKAKVYEYILNICIDNVSLVFLLKVIWYESYINWNWKSINLFRVLCFFPFFFFGGLSIK